MERRSTIDRNKVDEHDKSSMMKKKIKTQDPKEKEKSRQSHLNRYQHRGK